MTSSIRGSYAKHDGLRKRCACKRKRWSECAHPWFFNMAYRGQSYRFNLNREASKTFLSKTAAEVLRDDYKARIRAGTFRKPTTREAPADLETGMTFAALAEAYVKGYVQKVTRGAKSTRGMKWYIAAIRALELSPGERVESLPLTRFGVREIEAMRTLWTGRRPGAKGGMVAPNRMLSRLRHMFNWAIERGYLDAHPFKRHGRTVIRMDSDVEEIRTRRLVREVLDAQGRVKTPGEEARLLSKAGPHLYALIIAALESGCRLGELLGLQWTHVDLEQNMWLLPAANTKTRKAREVPTTPRLKAVLEMRRLDPAGEEHSPEAYVFGNEVGERVKSIRTAWENTCERAGIAGLRFHDLRREFASRLLESSAPAHEVRDWLGHTNITTTSRYLATTRIALQKACQRFEQHRPLPTPDALPAASVPARPH